MLNLKNKKVIAAVIEKDGKILIAQRAKQDALYGKWEFPGGKMESNETEHECLQRELFEEFGIKAHIGSYICSSFFEHKEHLTQMRVYYVHSFFGELHLYEHQQIKWVDRKELPLFDMPEPDKPIVMKLLSTL